MIYANYYESRNMFAALCGVLPLLRRMFYLLYYKKLVISLLLVIYKDIKIIFLLLYSMYIVWEVINF